MSAERGRAGIASLIDESDDVTIAAVTAAELLVGVQIADSRRRPKRAAFVEAVLETIPVDSYDIAVARSHALLLADVHRSRRARGAHDLLIAATALANDRTVVTADASGFSELPGIVVSAPTPRE